MGTENTIVGELEKICQAVSAQGAGESPAIPAGPVEQALIRYSIGTGTFNIFEGKGQIVVNGRMYTLAGQEDGIYQAVFQAWFTDATVLLNLPPSPPNPYDRPSPVVEINDVDQTKAKWTFGDGSWVAAPGPAISYLAQLKNGAFQFWVSAAAVITEGGGRYRNAIGQECSLGSTWFSGSPELKPGTTFEARVLHTFKIIPGNDRV